MIIISKKQKIHILFIGGKGNKKQKSSGFSGNIFSFLFQSSIFDNNHHIDWIITATILRDGPLLRILDNPLDNVCSSSSTKHHSILYSYHPLIHFLSFSLCFPLRKYTVFIVFVCVFWTFGPYIKLLGLVFFLFVCLFACLFTFHCFPKQQVSNIIKW